MQKYIIQQKIKSLAGLFSDEEIKGYTFKRYDSKDWSSDDLIVSKILLAKNFNDAYNNFRNNLIPILDALSVYVQASVSIIGQPFSVRRQDNNPDNIMFFCFAKYTKPVGLNFMKEEKNYLDKMIDNSKQMALSYMRQVNLTSTAYTRVVLLLITAEALAGNKSYPVCDNNKCVKNKDICIKTNRSELKRILGRKIYGKLYFGDNPLRNDLFHGRDIDEKTIVELIGPIYEGIIKYYNKKWSLNIKEIKSTPRVFNNTFKFGQDFYEIKDAEYFELKKIVDCVEPLIDKQDFDDDSRPFRFIVDPKKRDELNKSY